MIRESKQKGKLRNRKSFSEGKRPRVTATDLIVPLEVRRDGELHFQSGASDGLEMNGEVQSWELMDVFVNGLPHLWHSNQFAYTKRKTTAFSVSCRQRTA